jgi:transcriptional regulator with XRE-family HTH domain
MIKLFILLKNEVLRVDFGDELKRIRESRGMTVNQLAMYSEVSSATISRVENKKRGVPRPKYIKKLAEALKFPYTDLMRLAGYAGDEVTKELSIEETELNEERKRLANIIVNIKDPEKKKQAIAYLEYLANSPTDGAKK